MKVLRARLPSFNQLIPVFAVASTLIYGWTLYRVTDKLPSWLLYLNLMEIVSNYAYALVFNFLESCLVLGAVLTISMLLPKRFFGDMFVARGSLFAMLEIGYLIYLALAVGESKASQFPWEIFRWSVFILAGLFVLSVFLPLVAAIRRAAEGFADRAIIFLYLLVPLSSLAFIIVLFNNLF